MKKKVGAGHDEAHPIVREILRLVVVLTAICFVAALALSQVYEFTKEPIAHQKRLEMLRAIRVVLPEVDNEPDRDVVRLLLDRTTEDSPWEIAFFRGRVNQRVAGVAFMVESREGYGGNIEIMLGIDPNESILGVEMENPTGYGRLILDESGSVCGIVEEEDADPGQRQIRLVNSGIYCVQTEFLSWAVSCLGSDNAQGELYLTDIVGIGYRQGKPIGLMRHHDPEEVFGINTAAELTAAETIMRQRLRFKS